MANLAASRKNRRHAGRRACVLNVRYRVDGDWLPASAQDLSPTGCRLRTKEALASQASVTLAFDAPVHDGSQALFVEVPGVVVWSRGQGLSFLAGIQFESTPAVLQELIAAIGA